MHMCPTIPPRSHMLFAWHTKRRVASLMPTFQDTCIGICYHKTWRCGWEWYDEEWANGSCIGIVCWLNCFQVILHDDLWSSEIEWSWPEWYCIGDLHVLMEPQKIELSGLLRIIGSVHLNANSSTQGQKHRTWHFHSWLLHVKLDVAIGQLRWLFEMQCCLEKLSLWTWNIIMHMGFWKWSHNGLLDMRNILRWWDEFETSLAQTHAPPIYEWPPHGSSTNMQSDNICHWKNIPFPPSCKPNNLVSIFKCCYLQIPNFGPPCTHAKAPTWANTSTSIYIYVSEVNFASQYRTNVL